MKMDRLLAMVMLLLNRRRISARELADRFEVSLRTVYRDIETICAAGIPVVSHPGQTGGYEIMERYRLERQYLSLEELESMVIALRGIQGTMGVEHVDRLLNKVGAILAKSERDRVRGAEERIVIDLNPWKSDRGENERLSELKAAIAASRVVAFTYTRNDGQQSRRQCEPMLVVLKGYVWYLYGYCRLRNDYRIFRLSRIKSLATLDETFQRRPDAPQGPTLEWAESFSDGSPVVHMKLLVEPQGRAQAEDYYGQEQIQELPDGRLLIDATQPDEPWLYSWLLGFGAGVTVLEPPEVAQRLKAAAQQIVNLYPEY